MRKRFFHTIVLFALVHVISVGLASAARRVNESADANNHWIETPGCPLLEAVAPATLAGRVFNSAGVPLRSIRVVLIDTLHGAETRETITSTLGWYVFPGVETGRVYQLGIVSSRYQAFFQPVQPSGDVFNADIITFQ